MEGKRQTIGILNKIKNIYTTTDGLKIGVIDNSNDLYIFVRDNIDEKFDSG